MELQMNDWLKRSKVELEELEKWLERNKKLLSELEEIEHKRTQKDSNKSPVKELLLSKDYKIGRTVITCEDIANDLYHDEIFRAIQCCERKIRKNEIILFQVIPVTNRCGNSGTIFTEDKMYILESGHLEDTIEYVNIDDVDYMGSFVHITLSDNQTNEIFCDDESYAKTTCNMLMDIKKFLEKS